MLSAAEGRAGKRAGGLEIMTTPMTRQVPIRSLYTPQCSLRRTVDRRSVTAGVEKKMAVQSPMGSLLTASNMERSMRPPTTACAVILHLVARSGEARMGDLEHNRGSEEEPGLLTWTTRPEAASRHSGPGSAQTASARSSPRCGDQQT